MSHYCIPHCSSFPIWSVFRNRSRHQTVSVISMNRRCSKKITTATFIIIRERTLELPRETRSTDQSSWSCQQIEDVYGSLIGRITAPKRKIKPTFDNAQHLHRATHQTKLAPRHFPQKNHGMLRKDIFEPVTTEWENPVMLVSKQLGLLYFTVY